jgi:hypothetical protein
LGKTNSSNSKSCAQNLKQRLENDSEVSG